MKYRNVGKAGLKVSEIAVGSWMTDLKGNEAVETAAAVIRLAYEKEINFFDCADAYSGGEAEKFLDRILKDYPRSSIVVSSKVFFPTGSSVNERGLSRKHIMGNIDRTLGGLVDRGKILYYGVSEEWGGARQSQFR